MADNTKVKITEKNGIELEFDEEYELIAGNIPFDPSNCDAINQNDLQGAIEDLCESSAISASPGFTFSSSGNTTANTWLEVGNVPSNKTGINFPLYNGDLFQISVSNENVNTFDIELYEHDGTIFTLITTVSIIAQRSNVFNSTTWTPAGPKAITQGKELAAKLVNGSAKNPIVQIIAKGTENP
jgi:hypothetical protein